MKRVRSKAVRIASSHVITSCATIAAILLFVALGSKIVPAAIAGAALTDSSNTLTVAFLRDGIVKSPSKSIKPPRRRRYQRSRPPLYWGTASPYLPFGSAGGVYLTWVAPPPRIISKLTISMLASPAASIPRRLESVRRIKPCHRDAQ